MKLFLSSLIFMFSFFPLWSVSFELKNNVFIYNSENASYWEETRTTVTYLENVIQPTFIFDSKTAVFKVGIGLLTPFNQEDKIFAYYPFFQSQFRFGYWRLTLGSLDNHHDLPSPIENPLNRLTPQVRVISKSRVPLPYETFPLGLFSHGMYEYGLSLKWNAFLKGELYLNWQLRDTINHRERFDVGLTAKHTFSGIPFYAAAHYWHNGGHENPHPVAITENYHIAAGLHNSIFDILYLASYWIPDRENHPEQNMFGEALYLRYVFTLKNPNWKIESELFFSDQLLASNHRFISIEGDPFYRMPFYAGLNISYRWHISKQWVLDIAFKNGTFWPGPGTAWNSLMIRYDQMIKADFIIRYDLTSRTNSGKNKLNI